MWEVPVADLSLVDVRQFVIDEGKLRDLVAAAAGVANAIHIGAGEMIRGTMMEDDLRKALGLKPRQLVNIPKSVTRSREHE
jgi:hypothetical protein